MPQPDDAWDEPTEEYTPTLSLEAWPGDGRQMCRVGLRGGPDRRAPLEPGRFGHRSWETDPAVDVGFRCVVDA